MCIFYLLSSKVSFFCFSCFLIQAAAERALSTVPTDTTPETRAVTEGEAVKTKM